MKPSVRGKPFCEIDCHHKNKEPCAEPDPQVLHIKTHEQASWSSSEGRWFEIALTRAAHSQNPSLN